MYYIERCSELYSLSISKVVENMFATLGNGIGLDSCGFLNGNYRSGEVCDLGEPEPLQHIYPWSTTESYQPFRELAGCRDAGFKEAVQFFIDCIELTPDSVDGIGDWKDNLSMVEEVLLNTPTIGDTYTIDDMDKFLEDIDSPTIQNIVGQSKEDGGGESVSKEWFFDVQWSDCPKSVEKEVRCAWRKRDLGNDVYIWKVDLNEELFEGYPRVYFWLKHKGVQKDERVMVHWWW